MAADIKKIKLHDKEFRLLIEAAAIDMAISGIAQRLNRDLKDSKPLFVSALNGAFMFTSDLLKQIHIEGTEVSFVKVSSYEGTHSTGKITELIGLTEEISGRTVVILEDMIDTGKSIDFMIKQLQKSKPEKIVVVSMLYKPQALQHDINVDYYALSLGNDFVVGRGLDYDGLGRNLPDLYIIDKE